MAIRYYVGAALMTFAVAAHPDVIPNTVRTAVQQAFLSGWKTVTGTAAPTTRVAANKPHQVHAVDTALAPVAAVVADGGADTGAALRMASASPAATAEAPAVAVNANARFAAVADTGRLLASNGVTRLAAGHDILSVSPGNSMPLAGGGGGGVVASPASPVLLAGGEIHSDGDPVGKGGDASPDTLVPVAAPARGGLPGGQPGEPIAGLPGGPSPSTPDGLPPALPPLPLLVPPIAQLELPAAPSADVPEPSTIALMMVGLLGAGALTRRRS
jgi:hypothetical protein